VERSFFQRDGRFPSDHLPLVAAFAPTGALAD
jgi:hypothetical protein